MSTTRLLPPASSPRSSLRGHRASRCSRALVAASALVLTLLWASTGFAQAAQPVQPVPPVRPAPPKQPAPKTISLDCDDGVVLNVVYYAGMRGRDTVPVVLLHKRQGRMNDFISLIQPLRNAGHAILLVDLRGHGKSLLNKRNPDRPLSAETLRRDGFVAMVGYDMMAVEKFLAEKNNDGELNIDKLCVVGAEMGAAVGLYWTRLNWDRAGNALGKRGQDIKALVMISPQSDVPGLNLQMALKTPAPVGMIVTEERKQLKRDSKSLMRAPTADFRRDVSVLIQVGKSDKKAAATANRLESQLSTYRRKFEPFPEGGRKDAKDVYLPDYITSLQGTKLLDATNLNAVDHIVKFIDIHLVKRKIPWQNRHNRPYRVGAAQ